jgi:hypothetical protein
VGEPHQRLCGETWRPRISSNWQNPVKHWNLLNAVAYGGGRFVAAG